MAPVLEQTGCGTAGADDEQGKDATPERNSRPQVSMSQPGPQPIVGKAAAVTTK